MSLRKLKWRGIGRLELLAWLNEFLETDYTKIEHLADGIAYCQIFAVLYPGKVNLQQLNFRARTEMECERNMTVLRRTFHLCDIRKEIPIRKLVQGIFQEHFEFLHWIHDYVHRICPDTVRSHGIERRLENLRHSFSGSECSNTNAILQYSIPHETYIEGYAQEQYDAEIAESLLVDDFSSTEIHEDQNVDATPDYDGELDAVDPAMQVVRYSFRSTARAKLALTNLEGCMEGVGVVFSKSKTNLQSVSSRRPHSRPEGRKGGRKMKSRTMLALEDSAEPDPMMFRCISELIDYLESELLGRVKDLQYLEKNIEVLVEGQLWKQQS